MKKRFHIIAWGSDGHPDLDYYADESPRGLSWKYPYVSVALLEPVRYSDIKAAMDKDPNGKVGAERLAADPPRWECKAKPWVRSDPPQDCDWPVCGCDPYANKVIDALEEAGYVVKIP